MIWLENFLLFVFCYFRTLVTSRLRERWSPPEVLLCFLFDLFRSSINLQIDTLRFDSRCLCEVDISCVATVHTSCFCLLCGQLFSCDMSASVVHPSDVQRTVRVRKDVSTEWEFNCYFKKFFLSRHFYHYFLTILLIFHTPILHTFAFFSFSTLVIFLGIAEISLRTYFGPQFSILITLPR